MLFLLSYLTFSLKGKSKRLLKLLWPSRAYARGCNTDSLAGKTDLLWFYALKENKSVG